MYSILLLVLLSLINVCISNFITNKSSSILEDFINNISLERLKRILIVDGNPAELGEFPYMVSLQLNGKHICGGTLVDMKTIVTAAHCLTKIPDPLNYVAVAGIIKLDDSHERTRQSLKVVWALSHPDFFDGFAQSDIALLKVERSYIGTIYVNSINLVPQGNVPSGAATIMGWGATKQNGKLSNKLRRTVVVIVENTKCRYYYGDEVDGTFFCALPFTNREDACQGDSGGPVLCGYALCGIIASGGGCGIADEAGIYTNIGHFTSWIHQHLENPFF